MPGGTASEAYESQSIYGEYTTTLNEINKIRNILTDQSPDIPDDEETPKTTGHDDENIEDRPPKRRRVSEGASSSLPRKKQESPPWKKMIAEGPSSFTQDGVRKSGRTNQVPLELQPPSNKRQTRGAIQKTFSTKNKSAARSSGNRSLFTGTSHDAANMNGHSTRRTLSGKVEPRQTTKSPSRLHASRRSHESPNANELSPTSTRPYKRSMTHLTSRNGLPHGHARKGRPSTRSSDPFSGTMIDGANDMRHEDEAGSKVKVSRIRFRVNPPSLPTVHPDIVVRRKRLYPSFKDFVDKAGEVAIEQGGLLVAEDDTKYTTETASREARLIIRMEEAAKDGGVLSPGVSSAYRPEDQDKDRRSLLRQYALQDHLIKAVTGFRTLMVEEHNKHKRAAKRLAEACRDEWIRRQPKTAEEIEADALKVVEGRYKTLIRTLQATWDNVRAEVNRQRLKEWEAQEQVRVRRALNEAVDISTQKLEARRMNRDSEQLSDVLESDNSDIENQSADDSADSDSNISSSESEAEDDSHMAEIAEDEHLTIEELRRKYSNLPEPSVTLDTNMPDGSEPDESYVSGHDLLLDRQLSAISGDDDSDESIDMDDDMGSSDEDRSSDDEDDGAGSMDEDIDGEAGESGLLGFLAPSDLASLGLFEGQSEAVSMDEEDGMDEEDEVSLIPSASLPPTSTTTDTYHIVVDHGSQQDPHSKITEVSPDIDTAIDMGSGERSSQPTPNTTDTKSPEIDSASSVELQQNPRRSVTPQPSVNLKTPIPFLLRGTLREYQHYGLDWLAGLYANNTNGILADEMGLGKTIQTIALLAHLACEHHVWGPHLVVVPTSVMLNWEMEFKKWCPGFKILTYYGTIEERKKKRVGWGNQDSWNVCITSYQLVLQDQQVFKRKRWHYMILDEAHNIKNFRSQRWQTLLTFNTRARLLLTGTPLQNNLTELWSLLFFLMPSDGTDQGIGGFADLKEFSDWFRKPQEQILENGRDTMDDEARAIISKLHKVLRPYLLRRMKADVEKQMPAKYEHVEYCRLSRRQRELYDGFLSRSDTRGTLASGNYLSIINCLMQLRKVCNHPDLFQERPILSSFPMKKSVIADFEIKELLVRRRLLRVDPMSKASLEFLNLVPTKHESLSGAITERSSMLTAQRVLMDMREAQRLRAQYALGSMDPSTVRSNLLYLESASRWSRFEELQHCVYLNALRRQQKPIYGSQLVQLLDFGVKERPSLKKPDRLGRITDWVSSSSNVLRDMVPTLEQRSQSLHTIIQKFACVTPPIIAPDAIPLILTKRGIEFFQSAPARDKPDPFHEARMRLSVQFPDKRLLQYDCGKLQALAKLLRKLQAGGHRALIFTQMTKVLDILEQFLNIHGHRYLRLDGATKIEQRQILTDRFNNDTRILAFILSSRSGGLGINLTGADTVIFYDLDWNPAMDKQCQDRCHRIGQTRDVHIYRLISEHTIEANILRKANQKRMLDDVVIQEGEFTTDYFNKIPVRDVLTEEYSLSDGDAAANAAIDRVLGGAGSGGDMGRVLEQAEDQEDVAAAKVAQQEIFQTDADDFDEKAVTTAPTPKTQGTDTPMEDLPTSVVDMTPAPDTFAMVNGVKRSSGDAMDIDEDEINAWGGPIASSDIYMLKFMTAQLKDTPLELPKDKIKSKKGKDHRQRSHRVR